MSTQVGKDEYNLMKGKIQSLKQKLAKVDILTYDLVPLNLQEYNKSVSQVFQSMKSIDKNQKDLFQYDQLILGKIEGQSIKANFKFIVQSIVGQITDQKCQAYLKQKTQQRNFGLSNKDKNCSLKQLKKLQSLKKYFDVKQVQIKRKYNAQYRTYIKQLKKFLDLFQKTSQDNNQSISSTYDQFDNLKKQQKKLNQLAKQLETTNNVAQNKPIVQKPQIVQKPLINQIKENIVEQQKKEQKNQILQQEKSQNIKTIQQQKKQIENIPKTPKKQTNTAKRNKKQEQIAKPNPIEGQVNQNTQRLVNQTKQVPNQVSIPILKKDDKQRKLDFFIFKKPENPIKSLKKIEAQQKPIQLIKPQQKIQNTVTQIIPSSLWHKMSQSNSQQFPTIQYLRSQLKGYQMINQQQSNQPYFINMIITLSTIEYYDFLMKPQYQIDFTSPFKKIKNIFYYQDQSQEFQGQSADGNMQQESEQQQALSDGNNTILADDHLSNQQMSSCQSNQLDLKVQYGKASKWIYSHKNISIDFSIDVIMQFQIICLQTLTLPLKIEQEQEKVELTITPQIWRDLYKITHGNYGIKDNIIKQIGNVLPNVSKNWIDSMLKERSQKIGTQRFILKSFIQDLKDKITDIQQILQNIKNQKYLQLKKIKDEKNMQKDLKLQKDILQCTGSRYIINLMKQLKQKGYKQLRKSQLISFINQRNGEQWQKIKAQMNTMSMSITQMMKNIEGASKEQIKCQQEIIVQDEQFNKISQKQQKKSQQNSQNSTKQKVEQIQNEQKKPKAKRRNTRPVQLQQTLVFNKVPFKRPPPKQRSLFIKKEASKQTIETKNNINSDNFQPYNCQIIQLKQQQQHQIMMIEQQKQQRNISEMIEQQIQKQNCPLIENELMQKLKNINDSQNHLVKTSQKHMNSCQQNNQQIIINHFNPENNGENIFI